MCSDCGDNTAGEPNGGRKLPSRELCSTRARFRAIAGAFVCYLFYEGAEDALAAQGLEQMEEAALRFALVEVAPSLAASAHGETVGDRRAKLEAERLRVQRGLAMRQRAESLSGKQRRDLRLRRVACRAYAE